MTNIDGLGFDWDKLLTTKCKGCGNLLPNCTCEKVFPKKDYFKLIKLDEIKCPNCERPFLECICTKGDNLSSKSDYNYLNTFPEINIFIKEHICPFNCGRKGCNGECQIKKYILPKFEEII